jgi:O-antigen ligase
MPQAFFERLSLEDRGAGRIDIWIASLTLLPHYGLFGAGWNNFIVAYSNIAGNAPRFHGFTEGSHNIYVGMLIEVGAVGLTFLLLAFRSQLREARAWRVAVYEAACWGMVCMGFSLDVVWRKSFWMCWILLAMAVAAERGKNHEESA